MRKGFLNTKKVDCSKEVNQGVSDKPKPCDVIKDTYKKLEETETKSSEAKQSDRSSSSDRSTEMFPKGFLDAKKDKKDAVRKTMASSSKREATEGLQHAEKQKAKQRDRSTSPDHSKMKLPDDLKQFGGNTELAKAKVIFLGEYHIPQHHKAMVNFINNHANSGDIVLIEGLQADEELSKEVYAVQMSRIQGDVLRPFMKDVKIYGWDNMLAKDALYKSSLTSKELKEKLLKTRNIGLLKEIEDSNKLFDKLLAERDQEMSKTINNMRTRFPDKRLFIIAGKTHFTSSVIQENLKKQLYIALIPKYEKTEKDAEEFLRRKKFDL